MISAGALFANTVLRAATGPFLLAVSLRAGAAPTTEPLTIVGAFQESVGASNRCTSNFGGKIVGRGDSALLGRIAFNASDCISRTGLHFNFSEGRFVIVPASGDQIFASYSGQFVPTGVSLQYEFRAATFQITGGNGRDAKAGGSGTLSGKSNIVTGNGTLQLSGRITYGAKS